MQNGSENEVEIRMTKTTLCYKGNPIPKRVLLFILNRCGNLLF